MVRRFALALAGLFVVFASAVSADEIRPAVIEMAQVDEAKWSLDWKVPLTANRSSQPSLAVIPVIPKNCEYQTQPITRTVSLSQVGHAELRCEGEIEGQSVGLDGLFGRGDALLRFVPLETPAQTFRLTAQAPSATIAAEPSRWQIFQSYFVIGVEHILAGWDHLLFVIALVLLVVKPWPVVKAATAFTVAHSITLVATTLGYAGLPSRPVEALIALSIVFLAVEVALVWRRPDRQTLTRRYPWVVAFAFGLFHGFGFAGALAEIGLPPGEVPAALLAFNLGVEAGQLLVIAALFFLRALLVRSAPRAEATALKFATYGIGITASYWLFERVLL